MKKCERRAASQLDSKSIILVAALVSTMGEQRTILCLALILLLPLDGGPSQIGACRTSSASPKVRHSRQDSHHDHQGAQTDGQGNHHCFRATSVVLLRGVGIPSIRFLHCGAAGNVYPRIGSMGSTGDSGLGPHDGAQATHATEFWTRGTSIVTLEGW